MTEPIVTGVVRTDPPYAAGERAMLEAWLDYQRETLLYKCEGLDGAQLVERSCAPSTLSLLGLVRHMAEVERGWFRDRWQGAVPELYCTPDHRDGDFDLTEPERAGQDVAVFRAEVRASREEAGRHELDAVQEFPARGGAVRQISLRWIYVHLIEEYARHNGHADLLRERIDGATGD